MVRKRGLDVRSNWIFYNDSLLAVESLPTIEAAKTKVTPAAPGELQEILEENSEAIQDAGEAFYQKTLERNPGATIKHPWLHTIKLATYADTFTSGLEAKAEAVDPNVSSNSNDNYSRELIRHEQHPYLDAIDEQIFAWRVPGRMSGWNQARDGLWLQIKSRDQFEQDMSENNS